MAQFRATIQGNKGLASRLGTKKSGIVATVNGWTIGLKIIAKRANGQDIIEVWYTGGSNDPAVRCLLGTVKSCM